jgi:GNAT superfamily N-acetyltransferase
VNASQFAIRTLQPDEYRLLKALRLKALGSDPLSFWETVDEARAYNDAYWTTFTSKLTQPGGSRMFILEHGKSIGGFVFGVKKDGDEYRVGGLWVDPAHRSKGYGSLLVQQVVAWAVSDSNTAVIQLWCAFDSTMSFYQKNGFHSLGRFRSNDSDGRQIVEMEWRDADPR